MARADRRRVQRAKQTPGIRASGAATTLEETLFFSRLRRNAKWVFAVLALVFALSFVVFGVGSDVQGGIGDIFTGRGSSGGPSLGDAQKKVDANPRDAEALRELATALQTEGRLDEAVPVLDRFARLRPRDDAALRELATLYVSRAGRLRSEAQQAQARAQFANPDADLLPPTSTPLGQALADRPISNAIASQAQAELSSKIQAMQEAFRKAQETYQRIVVLRPEDAPTQLELADAALNAGDTPVAIAAYKRFLELAPDDPQAPLVEEQIKRLEGSGTSSSG
ncbi:MAG: tetratricopeptide repeat protein [Gaiellaceae bacterium]